MLAALAEQTLPPEEFEIVVVDDGSQPPARLPAQATARIIRHDRPRGPAAARNSGWQLTCSPLIAFTDDDCRPTPGWLAAMLDAAQGRTDVVVQGRVEPMPEERDTVRPLSDTIAVGGAVGLFVTCNVGYPRGLLEALHGFDESLRHAGEDVELGARALAAGAQEVFASDALVHHEVRQLPLPALVRKTWFWMESVRVLSLHPELRDLLVARVFWKPTHPLLLLALAGALTRRRTFAGVSLLPYLLHYLRVYRRAPRLIAGELPQHVVVDVAEIVTAAIGSARYRTLML